MHRGPHRARPLAERRIGSDATCFIRYGVRFAVFGPPSHRSGRFAANAPSTLEMWPRHLYWCGSWRKGSFLPDPSRGARPRGLDITLIQPYGCINADGRLPAGHRLRRPGGRHAARHRAPRPHGREGVAELAEHYPMSFAAVQKHVAVLERAGLVTKQRSGRRKVVRTNIEAPPPGARPARPVRGAVARSHRPHDRPHQPEQGDTPMTVTAVQKDPEALTLTLTAEFDAPPERVWELWADPRQLERWWGPPTYPATFTAHDLTPGQPRRVPHDRARAATSRAATGTSSRPIRRSRLVFLDGFANDDGTPNDDLPAQRGSWRPSSRSTPAAPGCPSRATSRAPRPWSRSWPWAWRRA